MPILHSRPYSKSVQQHLQPKSGQELVGRRREHLTARGFRIGQACFDHCRFPDSRLTADEDAAPGSGR
jgi:hypothetical protein